MINSISDRLSPYTFKPSWHGDTDSVKRSDAKADGLSESQAADDDAKTKNDDKSEDTSVAVKRKNVKELTDSEQKVVDQLKKTDTAIRAHEMAHIAAGGRYITSGAKYQYKKGPDGINYVVGGEVSIDVAAVSGDPEATSRKMQAVRRAALAPVDPSPQDRSVAAKAAQINTKALIELAVMRSQASAQSDTKQVEKESDSTSLQPYKITPDIEPGVLINVFG